MYFDLTADQKSLRDVLMTFLQRRFGGAEVIEMTAKTDLDRPLWNALSDLGLGGIMVPAEQGGLGMDLLTLTVVAETLGHYAAPSPVVSNAIAAWVVAEAGTHTQKMRWLEPLMSGAAIAAIVVPESAALLTATSSAAGHTATSMHAEWAAEAEVFIIVAPDGSFSLAELGSGITTELVDSLDRTRPLGTIFLDPLALSAMDADAELFQRLVDALLVTYAADALGAASAVQARAVEYAKERRQYGKPIGAFQALKHQLADISVELEPARPLCWYAAHCWDTGAYDTRRIAAITKAHLGEISVNASRAAIEAFGGIGYTWEHPAHLFLKRAMFDRSVLGTPAKHRERAAHLAGWGTSAETGAGRPARRAYG